MLKKWKGSYQYDSEKMREFIGYPRTFFTIEMEIFEDDTLKGTVQDDPRTGGMPGTGEIIGEVYQHSIYFEKRMPIRSIYDLRKGSRQTSDEPHPLIIYTGELDGENKYRGTWCFEKQWTFLFGLIPFKYSPGKGSWEMELVSE
jgi:hypothetical protein